MNELITSKLAEVDALKAELAALRPLPPEALQKIQEAWDTSTLC